MQLHITPPPHDPRRAVREVLSAAHALARRAGRPAVARVHVPLEVADPWAAWAALEQGVAGPVTGAWSQPGGPTILGVGAALELEGSVAAAQPAWRGALERWVDARPELPAALAGFAFAGAAGADPGWAGFGAGRVVVPRALVWRRDGRAGLALASVIAPEADVAVVHADLDSLRTTISAVLRGTPAAARAEPSAPPLRRTGDDAARAAWIDLVTRARGAVRARELEKLVVARAVDLAAPAGELWHAEDTARALRAAEPHAYVFAVRGAADAAWLVGATPELLAQVEGDRLATVALAGTRRRGLTPADDERLGDELCASAKDRVEHAIVVEAVRARIAALASAVDAAEEPRVVRHRAVMHLETRVRGALPRGVGALEVAAELHPTPAVSGAPGAAALEWLVREERLERGWYAGPVGWLDAAGGGHLAVALRSARLAGPVARAFAGCGIVAASDPAAEWDETEAKLTAIAAALSARPRGAR